MRVFSYGGGVQSTAALVLAARGEIDFETFLFANTGDDSENPKTLEYVRDVAMPYAAAHGVTLLELQKRRRGGALDSLFGELMRTDIRSVSIPVYMDGRAPGRRYCTTNFKIKVIERWLKDHGATMTAPALVAVGISVDEIERAKPGQRPDSVQEKTYPLLDLGLNRGDCRALIEGAGLAVPPKSACWFCPFKRRSEWREMRRDEPELFERAAQLEDALNARTDDGRARYISTYRRRLREAVSPDGEQLSLGFDGDGECDSGYCFT